MVSTDCHKIYVKVSNLPIKSIVNCCSVVLNDKLFSRDKNRIFDHSNYCERESWKMRVISPQYGFDYHEDENSKTWKKQKCFILLRIKKKKKTWIYFFRIRFIESSHLIFSRVDQKESWNRFVWNEKEKKKKRNIILYGMRKKRKKRKLKSFCLEWERKEKKVEIILFGMRKKRKLFTWTCKESCNEWSNQIKAFSFIP